MLASNSVQEAHDFALIAQAATLESRVPFLHFFDGFRTSHEINKIEQLEPDDIRAMIDEELVRAHRERALSPDRPVLARLGAEPGRLLPGPRGVEPVLPRAAGDRAADDGPLRRPRRAAVPPLRLRRGPGRRARDRHDGLGRGGRGGGVEALVARGEKVGLVKVRLYRPFDAAAFLAALPPTVRSIAVLDRTKEPGALGEPLYQDVITALVEAWPAHGDGRAGLPRVIGGRYGLSSKEFTPAMAAAIFDELARPEPKRHFTVGIVDDVTHLSLKHDPAFTTERDDVIRAVFYGFGSDGTVGANKNSVKIIGENTPLYAQGYFVYDSKKSGSTTVSHLRFSPRPIRSSYLIERANFVACHQFDFLERIDVLAVAEPGATFLLNSPYPADRGLGPAADGGPGADHRQGAQVLRGRRPARWRARRASAGGSTR